MSLVAVLIISVSTNIVLLLSMFALFHTRSAERNVMSLALHRLNVLEKRVTELEATVRAVKSHNSDLVHENESLVHENEKLRDEISSGRVIAAKVHLPKGTTA